MAEEDRTTPFGLRMPKDLRDWVKKRAWRNDRSMNGEIIAILREKRDEEQKKQAGEQ